MNKLIRNYVIAAVIIALIGGPIPGTSIILTLLELHMIRAIAQQHKQKLGWSDITKTAGYLFSAGEGLKIAAIELSTTVPIIGWWIAKPLIAAGVVIALGKAADLYFDNQAKGGTLKLPLKK